MSQTNKWFVLFAIAAAGLLIYALSPVLTPFAVAAILAYMGDPLVDRLEAWRLPRTLAVVIVFLVLTGIAALAVLVIVPLLEKQVLVFAQKLPGYIDWLQHKALPWVSARLGIEEMTLDVASIKQSLKGHWRQAGGLATHVLGSITSSGMVLMGWLANVILIPVVAFYLLRDWDRMIARIRVMLPRGIEPTVSELARSSDEVLGAFLRGQLLVMLGLAIIYSFGLWLVGLDLALLIGALSGLVSFVPYLGFIVGFLTAGVAAAIQYQDVTHVLYVAAVFVVAQGIEGTVLTPLLVGDRIGLHPVTVIFAVMAGGQLFGFLGVLLALPVAAVIAVLVRYAYAQYTDSSVYADS
jgi:predicted PurR-regulated permease PerM